MKPIWEQYGSSVPKLVEHGACNARIVGSIPGTIRTLNVCSQDCKLLSMKASAKWHIIITYFLFKFPILGVPVKYKYFQTDIFVNSMILTVTAQYTVTETICRRRKS